ncbi:MAG: acireductone synthase [Candidatus Obscuribacterales bacterium]|nr:acireductone synthase [Candidatus Obscuribacterales bacterium]
MPTVAFDASCILMDIEGTTSSIKFVYDILFPYVRENVSEYLNQFWTTAATQEAVQTIAVDLGYSGSDQWFANALKTKTGSNIDWQKIVVNQVNKLMDEDVKAPGLKNLQGLIWDIGYENGTLRSHVYDDVPIAIKAWKEAGKDLRIYSSGSAHAQEVFFNHTECGALSNYFGAFYDTSVGAKRESSSYRVIAEDTKLPREKILFLSDVPEELDAAKVAGMQVCLVYRPGNLANTYSPIVENFAQLKIEGVQIAHL